MAASPRPKALKLAVLFAGLILVANITKTIIYGEAIGEGWVLFLFFEFLIGAIFAVLLVFAYNGRGWVRYFMAFVYVLGFGRAAAADVRAFFDPFYLVTFLMAILALGFWFQPSTSRWYKNPYSAEAAEDHDHE